MNSGGTIRPNCNAGGMYPLEIAYTVSWKVTAASISKMQEELTN
jgi:hypothetical protein